jgi:hypothetical protein
MIAESQRATDLAGGILLEGADVIGFGRVRGYRQRGGSRD